MNQGDPHELLESIDDQEIIVQRAPVRVLADPHSLPAWMATIAEGHKGEHPKEIESTAQLQDVEHREKVKKQLLDDGATEIESANLEAESFEFKNICILAEDGAKPACARMNARVRTHRHTRGGRGWRGLIAEGKVRYHWTVKIKLSDGDELERFEYEEECWTRAGAIRGLQRKVQELLKLKKAPTFNRSQVNFRVEKSRRSYKYLKNAEPPRPCSGSRVDIDTVTKINGKKLATPLVTLDVEGPSVQAVAECRNCLGLGADEFSLRAWMQKNGFN
ncbi:MAG: hypothetical protein RLZZ283_157 [Candidatus Parcubacteria bacterium]|jgi:hypothetical protein